MKAVYPIIIHRFEDRPPHRIVTQFSLTDGYWICFESEIISGSAILYPCSHGIKELQSRPAPQSIFAETGVKGYEDFRLLAGDRALAERSEPLPDPGDYELTGQIWDVVTDGAGDVSSVRVFIGSLGFDLGKEDIAGMEAKEGPWVQFRVRELALYDVNY